MSKDVLAAQATGGQPTAGATYTDIELSNMRKVSPLSLMGVGDGEGACIYGVRDLLEGITVHVRSMGHL